MISCNSVRFRSSAKLIAGLIVITKEDLKDIANLLGVPIPTALHME